MTIDSQNVSAPKTITPLATVTGIPSPYSVASCRTDNLNYLMLVTSPSDNSVWVLKVPEGNVAGTVRVGPQPYSVVCFGSTGVVSNLGDNSLVLFDLATLKVTATIPGVPGSRGFHGIAVNEDFTANGIRNLAWVAGTDANVLTVVDLSNFKVLAQIPLARPTTVVPFSYSTTTPIFVASAGNNSINAYDQHTLQVTSTTPNVPNPQDFVFSGLGTFATIGGKDSVWRSDPTSTISGIPGAAAVGTTSFGSKPLPFNSVVIVASTSSNSLFLIQQQPLTPAQFSVANGASFGTGQMAAGALASAFATTGVSQSFFATSLPLPTSLGGVTLRVGGNLSFDATSGWTYSPVASIQAPLLFVGPSQINFQIPPGISPVDTVPAQLKKADGSTLLTTLNLGATSPGIFTVPANGQGQAAVLNLDNSQNGDPQRILGAKPAARGGVIQIFATGAGATNPPLAAGEAAPISGSPLVLTVAQPTVTIGGKTARVLFSGMAPGFVGLWQINAEIPPDVAPGSAVPFQVTAGGVASNTVTIAVQ